MFGYCCNIFNKENNEKSENFMKLQSKLYDIMPIYINEEILNRF